MHIVVIEDEPDLGSAIQEILEMEGHFVRLLANGLDGLYAALHARADLVILDVMLPELDGWEVLKALRQKSDVPVLMLTAKDTTQDRVRGLDFGADDYQTKPFEIEELKARVRALLRRRSGSSMNTIEFGPGLLFCQMSRKVTRDGEEVSLTSRELTLLEYFVQNRGRVLTRNMIDERFIDHSEADSNVVSVLIHRIRKKLGSEIIKTKRGLGFELVKYSSSKDSSS